MPRTKPAQGILDCGSVDFALISLANLLGEETRKLKASLTRLKPAELEAAATSQVIEWNTALWNKIVGLGTPAPVPRVVHWFHATRVQAKSDFSEGILPLSAVLPTIKSFLETLATEVPSTGRSTPFSPGFQYVLKTSNLIHEGPHAFLVRDAITRRASFTHDYLEMPEIVEDLGPSMQLTEKFKEITKPCIVKFRSPEPREDVTEIALSYCYSSLWGMEMDLHNNTHFAGHGQTIPRSDIISIEYPKIARLLPYKWYV
jgi:hypothetical protein